MQDFSLNFLIISLLIGIVSYALCTFYSQKGTNFSLSRFLFSGNSPVAGACSIVGTIFSGSILFAGMIVFYKMYGFYLMPIFAFSAMIGFLFLINVTQKQEIWQGSTFSQRDERAYIERLKFIISSTGNTRYFFIVVMLYLISSFVTELAVFKAAVLTFEDEPLVNDLSSLFLIVMISAYVYLSGFKGVLVTDFLQFALIFLSFLGMLYILYINDTKGFHFSISSMDMITSKDRILMGVATFFVSVSFLSSIPEILVRIMTIKNKRTAKRTAIYACVGVFVLLTFPVIVLMINEGEPLESIQLTEVFKIWETIINDESNMIFGWLVMIIIVAAIFTTIDTYILTCEQVVFLGTEVPHKYSVFLKNNFRYFSMAFILASVLMANHLSQWVQMIIGSMSISFPILLYFMIHFFPKFGIKKVPDFVYYIPLIIVFLITPWVLGQIQQNKPTYYFIPITTGVSQILVATIYVLLNRKGKRM